MSNRLMTNALLIVSALLFFLVVPFYSLMAQGGKVAGFALIVAFFLLCFCFNCFNELIVSRAMLPLLGLCCVFGISLLKSKWFFLGLTEFGVFVVGLLFCFFVTTLSSKNGEFHELLFLWLRIVGVIFAILCLYQYIDWLLYGQKNVTLIPYLLPPGSKRVGGSFGQPNMAALFLLVSYISFLAYYANGKPDSYKFKFFIIDLCFIFITISFFLTHSRSGLISLFCSYFVLYLLIRCKKIYIDKKVLLKIIFITLLGFFISQINLTSVGGLERSAISIDARFVFWCASLLMFLNSPLWGVGLDHFKLYLPANALKAHDILGFVEYEAMGYTNWSHNEFLQILAESGIVGLFFVFLFLVIIFFLFMKEVRKREKNDNFIYLFIILIPFIIHGSLSWPFRYPVLFFVFFLIVGVILSHDKFFVITNCFFNKVLSFVVFLLIIISFSYVSFFEIKYIDLKKSIKENGCEKSEILNLSKNKYLEFKVLREALPMCFSHPSFLLNEESIDDFMPLYEKIAHLQGTHKQWYNLALIYRKSGNNKLAKQALEQAINRQPVFEEGWKALHLLNVENAASVTGRPVEDFLLPASSKAVDFDSLLK